jgi:hypothetical protein
MITNGVMPLVVLTIQSSTWAHFKACETSFTMVYHTTALPSERETVQGH